VKILVLAENAHSTGGAEAVALNSARGLAERGHQVTLLAGAGPADNWDGNLRIVSVVEGEDPPLTKKEELLSLWNIKARKLVAEHLAAGYDVVHLHSGIRRLGPAAYRLVANADIPVIYTHHDYAWACPMQGLFDYRELKACELAPGSVGCLTRNCVGPGDMDYKLYRYAKHWGTHRMSGLGRASVSHIFVSAKSRDRLMGAVQGSSRCWVVPNPIDTKKGPPTDIQPQSGYAYVGRLTTEKNPVSVAKICELQGWEAVFIGDGPLRDAVRNLNPRAAMLGWLARPGVEAALRNCRAVVMPSLCYETHGMVGLEAWALGLPIVVSSNYGITNEVIDKSNGLVFTAGDEKDLRSKMLQLQDLEMARRMGRFAYDHFWSRPPTLARHLDQLEDVYLGAIGMRAAA